MRRHLRIGAIDLRVVEASLDDGDLGIVRHKQPRHPADRRKRMRVSADPIGEPLCPRRLRIGEVRRTHDGNEDLCLSDLSGQPIRDGNAVPGIIDEQLVTADVALTHRHRQPTFPAAVELAEARVAVAVRVALDVLIPQDRKRHVFALEFAMDADPIRLGVATMPLLGGGDAVQACFQNFVGHLVSKRPAQPRRCKALQRLAHRRWC